LISFEDVHDGFAALDMNATGAERCAEAMHMLVTGVQAPHRLDVQRSCGVVETSQHATIMSAAPLGRTQAFAIPARTDIRVIIGKLASPLPLSVSPSKADIRWGDR
jgi:hypothetical protein